MTKYKYNVNENCIEKDKRFFAYVDVVDVNRIVKLLNEQEERIKELETRNKRQYERLKNIGELMFKRDWETLGLIVDKWEKEEEQLQKYGG